MARTTLEPLSPKTIRQELRQILKSKYFANSKVVSEFLDFVVEKTLRGQAQTLKEYTIAVEVYGKDPEFDPRIDPIVRVEARRLRSKLINYYQHEGQNSPVRIAVPIGSYIPDFRRRTWVECETPSILTLNSCSEWQLEKRVVSNTWDAKDKEVRRRYLSGHHSICKWSPEGLRKAVEYYEQMIVEEPCCPLGYFLLADAYFMLVLHGLYPTCEIMPKARVTALRALELDRSQTGAHALLAFVEAHYNWNWDEATREYQYALKRDPLYVGAYQGYCWCLAMSGHLGEAITVGKRLVAIDPVSTVAKLNLGSLYYLARDFSRARELYNAAISLDRSFFWPYLWLGRVCAVEFQLDKAVGVLQKARILSYDSPVALGMLGYCYALLGKKAAARKLLKRLEELSHIRFVSSLHFAYVHIGLGERDHAFHRLRMAATERHPYVATLKTAPIYDSIRSDPRFPLLLRQMNLRD